jgi:tetratricopeptide (TPR) repeat protein
LFSQHEEVLSRCDEVERMVVRVHGETSSNMADLLYRRGLALKNLRRYDEARSAATAALKIIEQVHGRGEEYATGLQVLADILYREGKYEEGLKQIEEARSLMMPHFDPLILCNLLNTHAILLRETKQYQKAVLVREEELALTLRLYGPNHPEYATSLRNAALLYA